MFSSYNNLIDFVTYRLHSFGPNSPFSNHMYQYADASGVRTYSSFTEVDSQKLGEETIDFKLPVEHKHGC